jgi:ethanolamine utilization protein EutN
MRLGHVIGRVTLSQHDPAYAGGRFLLVQPFGREQFAGAGAMPLAKGSTLVVYDNLGAGDGHVIGFTEGAEATAPFENPTPVDAFNACIVDQVFHQPPAGPAAAK